MKGPAKAKTCSSTAAEVVIPPRSGLIGQAVFPGMITDSGDLVVLAVHRGGAEVAASDENSNMGGVVLQAGDTMLLQGTWKALDVRLNDPDVLVVSSPDLVRRQAVPMGPGALQAIAILIGMVVLLATGQCWLIALLPLSAALALTLFLLAYSC